MSNVLKELTDGGYFDIYGLVLNVSNGPSTDNGPLFSSEALIASMQQNENTEQYSIFKLFYYRSIAACALESGLYKRHPDHHYQTGVDDYVGILAASKLCFQDATVAKEIEAYGKKHWWVFNNEQPGKWSGKAFLGRMLGFVAHAKLCAGKNPNIFLRLVAAIGMYLTTKKNPGDTSNRILMHLQVLCLDSHFISRWMRRKWYEHLFKIYGDRGIGVALEYYFGAAHPITKYLK